MNVVKRSSLQFDIIAHVNTIEETKDRVDCGDWRLDREIGRGAYGVVYLATNGKGERAAVKVCRRNDTGEERYERELRGAKLYSLIPPQEGLVRMREFAEEPWGFYAVMDLADDEFGGDCTASSEYRPKTLARVIEGEKALPLSACVRLGLALAKGLVVLQRHHLLHRDIKPGNVLYVGGRPVLSDPGLVVEESEAVSRVGTPGYVPPENFTGAAGDIYSLGLTLKAASFGRHIEDLDKGPALEADTGANLFPAWWRILNKATDPTPSRRYQSAKAILKELKRLHLRMAFARFAWAYKSAMSLLGVFAVAYGYVSYRERKRVESERKRLEAEIKPLKLVADNLRTLNEMSAQDDMVWSSFSGSYFCRTDESHRQRLKRVEEKDPASAAAMRGILDKMLEVDKKGEENNRRINALHDQNKNKGEKGEGASERYNQAEMLSMENEKLVKSWLSLLERFTEIEDTVKVKLNK
jgi:serine/threonine protein kinase